MKNVLLVGGTGFIGSHLVEKLACQGYKTTVLVRPNSDTNFVKQVKGINLFQGDLLNYNSLAKALAKIDTVFCLVNIKIKGKTRQEYEKQLFLLHHKGTNNLVKACKANRVSKLIYFSSVAAIGSPSQAYGKAKLMAEQIIKARMRNFIIIRPVNLFGERGLGPLKKIIFFLNLGIVPILGSGNNWQSISYVGNVVNEAILLAQNNTALGRTFICGDDKPYTVNNLINSVSKAMKKNCLKIHLPLGIARCIYWNKENFNAITTNRIFSTLTVFKEYGYKQEYSLPQAIKKTLTWLNRFSIA